MKNKIMIFSIVIIIIFVCIGALYFLKYKSSQKNDNKENNKINENVYENNIETEDKISDIFNLINTKSDLPVEYMSRYNNEDEDLKNYEFIDNFMSKDYSGENISFSYYGYPTDESDYYLGKINLKTNKYNILGVYIGDSYFEGVGMIEQYGFKIEKQDEYETILKYDDDFSIKLISDLENNNIIKSIELEAESKYLGNRDY